MPTRHVSFTRDQWAALPAPAASLAVPPFAESDFDALRGINEHLSEAEVTEVYQPLARLLHVRVTAAQAVRLPTDNLGGAELPPVPFIVGIGGSVAVGKSTTARILQALLARWSEHPTVDLVTSDGFLFPNAELEARGLSARKGFPESYDASRLVDFLAGIKAGRQVSAPVYSHDTYDIVPGEAHTFCRPAILIVEGLNVLQSEPGQQVFVADLLDFSVYVDADEADIERWYVERFLALTATVLQQPRSFYHQFAAMPDDELVALAVRVWRDVNAVNLKQNIAPFRSRADVILEKGPDHSVRRLHLRDR